MTKEERIAKEWLRTEHQEGNIQSLVNLILSFTVPKERQIAKLEEEKAELTDELKLTNNECKEMREELRQRIRENQNLCEQIEKMKKYGKLLQDICVVLGNDNFMVAVQLESVVKKLWDSSEEKEGLKMVEDIESRLLKIKPQEWAEINEWEIKEK